MVSLKAYTSVVGTATVAGVAFAHIVNSIGSYFLEELLSLRDLSARARLYVLPMLLIAVVAHWVTPSSSQGSSKKLKSLASITNVLKREEQGAPRSLREIVSFGLVSAFNLCLGVSLGRFGPCCVLGSSLGTLFGTRREAQEQDEQRSLQRDDHDDSSPISTAATTSSAAAAAATTTSATTSAASSSSSSSSTDASLLAACGLVACVSTCMATPVSAVLFVAETLREAPRWWMLPIMLAAVAGFSTGRFFDCGAPFASRMHPTIWLMFNSPVELALSALIGLATALVFRCLTQLLNAVTRIVSTNARLDHYAPFVACACMVALIAVNPVVAGTSDTYVRSLLAKTAADEPSMLLQVLVCKALALCVCLVGRLLGGAVGPCITIGTCLAALVFALVEQIRPGLQVDSHLMAAAGSASMVAAALRMPLFATVLCCEIFGSIHGAAFVCLSAALAYALTMTPQELQHGHVSSSQASSRTSLLPLTTQQRSGAAALPHSRTTLAGLVSTNCDVVQANTSVASLLDTLRKAERFVVVMDGPRFLGFVDVRQCLLLPAHYGARASDVVHWTGAAVDASCTLASAAETAAQLAVPVLAVCTGGHCRGIVHMSTLAHAALL
jgi:H+/Cl- antiporter ClcA